MRHRLPLLALCFLLTRDVEGQRLLRLVEEWRWGGTEADTLFGNVIGGAAIGPRDQLTVVLPDLGRALWGGLGQARLRTIGGQGAGPGEFRRPVTTGWASDSVWVWDIGTNRLTWLDAEGQLRGSEVSTISGSVTPLPSGDWVLQRGVPVGDTTRAVLLVGRDRRTTTQIAIVTWPASPRFELKRGDRAIVGHQPFAELAVVVVDPRGPHVVTVEPTRPPGQVRYRRLALDGTAIAEAAIALPLQELTDAHFEAALETRRQGLLREIPREVMARAIHRPRHLPTLRGHVLADTGTLWLRAGPESPDTVTWLGLDERARIVARFAAPADLRPLTVRRGRLVGTRTDADGLVSLVQYRLDEP